VGTASRVQGVGFEVLPKRSSVVTRGLPTAGRNRLPVLPNPGDFHWRSHGDGHMWDPTSIANLQVAARNNSTEAYWPLRSNQ
jgi:glutamate synthase (NADPH/NADH) large chain